MNKLREFPEWPIEQVIETAQMLYSLRPFKIDNKSELQWNSLAREAFDFLDKLRKACEKIAKQRSATDSAYRRAETQSAAADKIPEIVPFDEAIRIITRENRTKRAEKKFEKLVLENPRYFGGLFGKAPTSGMLNAQIRRWQKNGIPRHEVMELQDVFEKSWPRIKAAGNRAKARKRRQWEGDRVSKKLSETFAKIA